MNRILVLGMFAALLLTCCKKANQRQPVDHSHDKTPSGPVTMICLERTPGFGYGSLYTLTINADQSFLFEAPTGGTNVVRRTGTISQEDFNGLVAEIEKAGFFQMDDSYFGKRHGNLMEVYTDMAGAATTVTKGGVTKKVLDNNHYPPELVQIEELIDRVTNTSAEPGK